MLKRKRTHKLPWDLTLIVFYVRYLCSIYFTRTQFNTVVYAHTRTFACAHMHASSNLDHMLHSFYT